MGQKSIRGWLGLCEWVTLPLLASDTVAHWSNLSPESGSRAHRSQLLQEPEELDKVQLGERHPEAAYNCGEVGEEGKSEGAEISVGLSALKAFPEHSLRHSSHIYGIAKACTAAVRRERDLLVERLLHRNVLSLQCARSVGCS